MRNQTANMFINYHRNPTVIKWMKINTLAKVISCNGTLTLVDVWRQGVTGQKVGEAAARQGGFEITSLLLNVFQKFKYSQNTPFYRYCNIM